MHSFMWGRSPLQDLRRWHIDSLFGNTFRDALLGNVFDDFHILFANLRHGYITSVFDDTLRDAPLRSDLRDFQDLFLDLRRWYMDVLLGNDRDHVFHDLRHWHIHDLGLLLRQEAQSAAHLQLGAHCVGMDTVGASNTVPSVRTASGCHSTCYNWT